MQQLRQKMHIWSLNFDSERGEARPKMERYPSQPEVLNREMELAELALLRNLHNYVFALNEGTKEPLRMEKFAYANPVTSQLLC